MVDNKAFSKTIAIVAVIIIIVVAAAVALLLTSTPTPTPTTPKPTPATSIASPTSPFTSPPTSTPTTPTASPTSPPAASPTPSPTPPSPTTTTIPIQPIVNFRAGAYAEYLMKTFMDSKVMEGTYKLSIDGEEEYKGTMCWLLSMTVTQERIKTVVTWWIAKTGYKPVHGRMQAYMDDKLVLQQEFDPGEAPPQVGEAMEPKPVDIRYAIGYETITVTAGTFMNCIKVEVKSEDMASTIWVHSNVPIWGMVKSETYKGGKLMMEMELASYSG